MAEKIKVALLGAGNVGSQAARILVEDNAVLEKRIGAPVELIGIAVRDTNASRHWNADPSLYTTDAESLIDAADVVIELTGGIEPARTRILRALKAGKSVVSGNKALLAKHGVELQAAADESGAQLSYEAAVAGAIPILRPLRDSLAGDRVTRVLGIMNGTTNYILDQMDTTGASFADALAEAQKLGYAEADPTADVEGHDAASKAAIVASLAFHSDFTIDDVHTEGITSITADDVAAADADGYVIKLLAICEREGADGANIRVNPTLIPRQHPLAGVHGAFNAVFVEAECPWLVVWCWVVPVSRRLLTRSCTQPAWIMWCLATRWVFWLRTAWAFWRILPVSLPSTVFRWIRCASPPRRRARLRFVW